jgi:hypothetical protein
MTQGGESQADAAPSARIDTTTPSVARCYDAMLGGKDNYAVDREVVAEVLRRAPSMYTVTRDNRNWLVRVVRYLADTVGIEQFLDLGSGLPTAENTHQVVQRINRDAKVVYVDNDPMVLVHGRALLEDSERVHFVGADLTRPDELLADPTIAKYLNFDEPIALLQLATLHHVADAENPRAIMRRYVDALCPGSYVALSHFHNPGGDGELSRLADDLQQLALENVGSGRFRGLDEITRLFDGLELLDPGLVVVRDWWPEGPQPTPLEPAQHLLLGGLARKP